MLAKLKRILFWLDEHILLYLASFLIAFIPLYPKIPIFSLIEQYIVRVRFEDLIILFTTFVWGIQTLRRKTKFASSVTWMILAYLVVGGLSVLSALYFINSVPLEQLHISKTLLHYFRYFEYFSLFFILFAAIKTRPQAIIALKTLALTVLAVSLYGYGQKYFYWPVYSTMNREFSKGVRLVLTEHARVQSTFAGHYDMGAYLVFTLPVILALGFVSSSKRWRWLMHSSYTLGAWLLILSASRTPFGAFMIGSALVILLSSYTLRNMTFPQKTWLAIKRGLITCGAIVTIFYYFGGDMSERLSHVIDSNPQLQQISQTVVMKNPLAQAMGSLLSFLPTPAELQASLPRGKAPSNSISTDDVAAAAMVKDVASLSDLPPVPANPTAPVASVKPTALPRGVYEDIPDSIELVEVTTQGGEKVVKEVVHRRVYSECALEKELSLCIRLETLWPRAMEGFLRYPLLGSGYATLAKENFTDFTIAESTDNNFLRTLGETGALGFISFYGIVVVVIVLAMANLNNQDQLKKSLSIGVLAGSISLLLNAVYIDVFVASKVAESYWAMIGIFMALLYLKPEKDQIKLAEAMMSAQRVTGTKTAKKKKTSSKKNKTKK